MDTVFFCPTLIFCSLGNQILLTVLSFPLPVHDPCVFKEATASAAFPLFVLVSLLWLWFLLSSLSYASVGLVLSHLTCSSASLLMPTFCFKDPIASISFESMETQFSEFQSRSLNCQHSLPFFPVFSFLCMLIHLWSLLIFKGAQLFNEGEQRTIWGSKMRKCAALIQIWVKYFPPICTFF